MTPAERTRAILVAIADKHGVTVDDILGPRKAARLVRARDEAIAAVREARPNWSTLRLAALFNRDHTSIMAALNRPKFRDRTRAWGQKTRLANMEART